VATHVWAIRSPDGGATGLEFALARLEASERVLGHALPSTIDVEVRDEAGAVVARADGLKGDAETPMARLWIEGGTVRREQVWPGPEDHGLPVILPGGEVGILTSWWNAPDGSEWRWRIELYNHR
jgi:hypothetical protein